MRPHLQWLLLLLVPLLQGQVSSSSPAAATPDLEPYAWIEELGTPLPPLASIEHLFPSPAGFERVPVAEGSFAQWMRGLPLRTDRREVLAYNGQELDRPSAAVLLLDVGSRDLMQCADSVIRLHAEYLWSQGRASEAAYRFTSGDLTRWPDWRKGERFVIRGSKVQRIRGEARTDSHSSYRRWLDLVFTYAGTSSLARDTPKPPTSSPTRAGDFFVDPGFPGHAVIVLDVAEDATGRRLALLAQGFMPAEEVHVLRSARAVDGHWFALPTGEDQVLDTPSWAPFQRSARRRFR